ncbi:MAG: ABC transporter substrate-binding protein [Rhodobacteraceae bacterium]|nr:ABC transporter substrate-binding protein [Paracoccaceae bacterium]
MQTNLINRRLVLSSLAALLATPLLSGSARALTKSEAESLISQLSKEIFTVINSGKSESAMYRDFEKIFVRYADVPIIARSSLGVARRSASPAQMKSYTSAFQGYVSRKYGKRFREFIGATIDVKRARKTKRGYLVTTNVTFVGNPPFIVEWQVSDASGKKKMFDLIIEGISMLTLERQEIGNMLDRRGGDLNKLISHLKRAG